MPFYVAAAVGAPTKGLRGGPTKFILGRLGLVTLDILPKHPSNY
jgi:hypothetical protein